MDLIKNHLPTITALQTNSNGKDLSNGKPNAVYLAAVIRIITKAISLANSPTISDSEMRERAADWAESLFGLVPEPDLPTAFQRAVKDHQSTFPVSMYEVKEAFKKIDAERKAEQAENQAKLIAKVERESPNFNVCAQCGGCGFRRTFERDAWGTEHWGVVYCYDCEYWSRRKAMRSNEGHYKS